MNEYDEYLVGYQRAAVATEAIAAMLNAGQAVVLACGLTAVLVAAATATPAGTFTAGDLVSAAALQRGITCGCCSLCHRRTFQPPCA